MGSAAHRPQVSFVIPVLNGEREIGRCLDAIDRLGGGPTVETVILDNGSTDRTREVVSATGRECVEVPRGHVAALRNRGVALAAGAIVAFIDADVEIDPGWMSAMWAVFDEPGVVAAGSFPEVPTPATWVQRAWDAHQRRPHDRRRPVAWLPSMNLAVRRADFMAVRGFDERLETAEDVDLCYRLGARGMIVSEPRMRAVHWGEAPDLRTFWRKERWRGVGNLHGVFAHGFRWDELPSVAYPLYMLFAGCLVIVGAAADVWLQRWVLSPIAVVALVAPALVLALATVTRAQRPRFIPSLWLLYVIYGVARACSILRPPRRK